MCRTAAFNRRDPILMFKGNPGCDAVLVFDSKWKLTVYAYGLVQLLSNQGVHVHVLTALLSTSRVDILDLSWQLRRHNNFCRCCNVSSESSLQGYSTRCTRR